MTEDEKAARRKMTTYLLFIAETEWETFRVIEPLTPEQRDQCRQWEADGYPVPSDDVLKEMLVLMVQARLIEPRTGLSDNPIKN